MNNQGKSYQEILDSDGKIFITVKGISMLPMLRQKRDIVIIENKPYKVHDVVLFERFEENGQKSYVLHRIVKKNKDGSYLIWGDNTFTGDVVKEENIMGVLTYFIRDGKLITLTDFRYRLYVFFYCNPYRLRVALKKSFIAWYFRALKKRLRKRRLKLES